MPVVLRWLLRLGPTNPIAVRLVQNASRRTKHLLVRSGYLGVLILVLLWTLLVNASGSGLSYRELAAAGSASFIGIAYLQIGLICILSPVFMAGAIAQESDPKTWDILLTTPMTQTEIVLGNLFGRLVFVLALLMASLPLFALTQYFGGVPGRSIFASYLVAACAALLVGTIAIALAVSRLAGRRAVFTFYVAVITYLAVTWAVDAYLRGVAMGAGPAGQGVTFMTATNPFLALTALLNPSGYPRALEGSHTGFAAFVLEKPVTAWCTLSAGLSVLLMLASTVTVRAGGLATIGQGASGIPIHRRLLRLGAKDTEHRAPRSVWHNPIAWREAAARNATLGRTLAHWSFIGFGLLLGIGLIVAFDLSTMSLNTFRFALKAIVWTELAIITLVAINMAATAVSREREDGTLDLILTTPITPAMYLTGKLRGLVAYLMPTLAVPIITLAAASLYSMIGGVAKRTGVMEYGVFNTGGGMTTATTGAGASSITITPVLLEAPILAAIVLVPFIAFCVMVGLQWSLKSKGTIGSVIATVGVVAAVAGVIGLCAWNAGGSIEIIGPAMAALSPASLLGAVITPVYSLGSTVATGPSGLTTARIALAVGAVASAALHIAIVYGIHTSMVRNFDFTVRKLAGNR